MTVVTFVVGGVSKDIDVSGFDVISTPTGYFFVITPTADVSDTLNTSLLGQMVVVKIGDSTYEGRVSTFGWREGGNIRIGLEVGG